ncbi:hypothetical protein [Actinoallomurus sp. CA-142502]|uniref:hypothetical protein n=1 Tax=Actinoallomurus sp. CA-142502 TaxID=3239885 RepID=UPI003D93C143
MAVLDAAPVSEPGEWRYALHDLATGEQIAEHVPFDVQPFDRSLPEAGTLTATLPVDDPLVQKMDPWGRAQPRRTTLVPCRDDQAMGEYLIWNRPDYKASAKVMTVSCMEVRSYFDKHRVLRPTDGYGSRKTLEFTQTDAFDVFRALLSDAQAVMFEDMPVGDIGVIADPTVMSGQLIDRRDTEDDAGAYHGYTFDYYGKLFDDLASSVGFEWRVDSFFDQDNRLRRRLVLGYPHVGRPFDADSLTLEYPGTIADYVYPEDGENSPNYLAALGAGEEEAMVWAEAVNAAELRGGYPLLETTASYKNDSVQSIAAQHAAAELARTQGDITVPSFNLIGVPNVAPGDYVRARISDEARFPGSTVTPKEISARVISLRITPGPKERTTLVIEDPRDTGAAA